MTARPQRFHHLVTVQGSFEASVVCAHLAAEGIVYEVRGSADGPYRMAVGPMAEVAIFVREEDLALAQAVIADKPVGQPPPDDADDDDLAAARSSIFDDPSIPQPPPAPQRDTEFDDEVSYAYARSARPDTRPQGPPPPPRMRRCIP